jgi:hypothetical protein
MQDDVRALAVGGGRIYVGGNTLGAFRGYVNRGAIDNYVITFADE